MSITPRCPTHTVELQWSEPSQHSSTQVPYWVCRECSDEWIRGEITITELVERKDTAILRFYQQTR